MKVLIVCSKNSGKIAPFITEQVFALTQSGVITDYFTVEQKGWKGYWRSRKSLLKKIAEFQPDLIHAHYGLSGLLANLQRKMPVVTTYHGSDINVQKAFRFSRVAIFLSKYNIFVSEKNIQKSKVKKKFELIPCGVDTMSFYPQDKIECRKQLNLDLNQKYILFASAFDNAVKNSKLAISAVKQLQDVQLIELKGYSRNEVALLMNAVDVCLMTSFSEGSPQFIKEAMACNCPIVSVDVGDVKDVIGETEGCFVSETYNVEEITENIKSALQLGKRTNGNIRLKQLKYDEDSISKKIISVYQQLIN